MLDITEVLIVSRMNFFSSPVVSLFVKPFEKNLGSSVIGFFLPCDIQNQDPLVLGVANSKTAVFWKPGKKGDSTMAFSPNTFIGK